MNWMGRLRTVMHANFAPIRGATHAERLDDYYRDQASQYDAFRTHLLHGRPELLKALPIAEGDRLVELGGGTGWNIEALGPARERCRSIELVDLCPALLALARERVRSNGWSNVSVTEADATVFLPADGPVDVVLLSYSMTMMPDWFAALDRAHEMLRPGGIVGVTDFYVSRPYPEAGLRRHAWWQRRLWPMIFRGHNVWLSHDHVPYLRRRFETVQLTESFGPMPFMLGLEPPYYVFLGRRRPTVDACVGPR